MTRENGSVDAILLASGFSRRFGAEDKLLYPFRGKPLARHTLDLVCGLNSGGAPAFRRIFFVAAKDEVKALARDLPVTIIHNGAPERGQRESVRLGVAASSPDGASSEVAYYLFFPCDQPLLDADTVRRILEAREPGRIVEPCFGGQPGNPCLFAACFREDLLSLGPGEHPRDIKARRKDAVISVELEGAEALLDFDDNLGAAGAGP